MVQLNPIFKKSYTDYLEKLDAIHFSLLSPVLNITVDEDRKIAQIPFFQKNYKVSRSGVVDNNGKRADYDTCVILLKYLLMCPKQIPQGNDWISFRDLKSSGYTQHSSLADYAIQLIADYFSGNKSRLSRAVRALQGKPPETDYPYDLSAIVPVLPRVPILFLFNDTEKHFPAQVFILYERRAENFLDPECLAMIGSSLFKHLKRTQEGNV